MVERSSWYIANPPFQTSITQNKYLTVFVEMILDRLYGQQSIKGLDCQN